MGLSKLHIFSCRESSAKSTEYNVTYKPQLLSKPLSFFFFFYSVTFLHFRDASFGVCTYNLNLFDCLSGVNKVFLNDQYNIVLYHISTYY